MSFIASEPAMESIQVALWGSFYFNMNLFCWFFVIVNLIFDSKKKYFFLLLFVWNLNTILLNRLTKKSPNSSCFHLQRRHRVRCCIIDKVFWRLSKAKQVSSFFLKKIQFPFMPLLYFDWNSALARGAKTLQTPRVAFATQFLAQESHTLSINKNKHLFYGMYLFIWLEKRD